jgi:hypothetical protein
MANRSRRLHISLSLPGPLNRLYCIITVSITFVM